MCFTLIDCDSFHQKSIQQKLLTKLYDNISDLIKVGMSENDIRNAVNNIIKIEL